jgi:hypothetical protein
MRAFEFLKESKSKSHGRASKIHDRQDAALPGVFVQRELRNTDPYMQYRYNMAVASARAIANGDLTVDQFNQESAWAENLVQVMYTPEDEKTIELASKLMGVKPTRISDNVSREPKGTESVSPVAKPKRNKYGI